MQGKADEAVAALAGTHFDIPDPIRTIECRIAPTQTGGIYYTGPSDDLSRPGRMWWSVPRGVTTFGTWRELTTVYHEGVPGHHLQTALAAEGIATLRFDFTGLGASEGDFADSNFTSNVTDLLAAADFLRREYQAPALLIGHSLGGAAVLAAGGAFLLVTFLFARKEK